MPFPVSEDVTLLSIVENTELAVTEAVKHFEVIL